MKLSDLVNQFQSRKLAAKAFNVSIYSLNNWLSQDRDVLRLDDGSYILDSKLITKIYCPDKR